MILFQACGLSFSVRKDVAVPQSLKNMYKELEADITGFKVDCSCFPRASLEESFLEYFGDDLSSMFAQHSAIPLLNQVVDRRSAKFNLFGGV